MRQGAARGARNSSCTTALVLVFLLQCVAATSSPAQSPDALTLDAVLAAAAQQNPLVDAARARVAAARGGRTTAGTLPNPVLTYWTESAPFPFQASRPGLERETQTYATMPLEFLYQRPAAVRSADASLAAASADLTRARQTVALDAARAFYRVAAAQVAVESAVDVRARLAELVAYNAARVREGKTAEADLIRTQVELDRVEATAALSEAALMAARAGIAPYLGDTDRSTERLRVRFDDESPAPTGAQPLPSMSLDAALASARAMRADIIAARARVEAANADANYQRALTIRHVGATFGSKRTGGVTSMIAGVTVPFPLFDQNRGAVQQSTALQRAATADLAWALRRATAEVQSAYASAHTLSAHVTRMRSTMLVRAEESRRIALAAYQEGAIGLLQVLDASRTLADARQTWYQLLFASRESELALRAAIGDPTLGAPPANADDSSRADARTTPTFPAHALARPTGDRP